MSLRSEQAESIILSRGMNNGVDKSYYSRFVPAVALISFQLACETFNAKFCHRYTIVMSLIYSVWAIWFDSHFDPMDWRAVNWFNSSSARDRPSWSLRIQFSQYEPLDFIINSIPWICNQKCWSFMKLFITHSLIRIHDNIEHPDTVEPYIHQHIIL